MPPLIESHADRELLAVINFLSAKGMESLKCFGRCLKCMDNIL